jgi:hypothetical protein
MATGGRDSAAHLFVGFGQRVQRRGAGLQASGLDFTPLGHRLATHLLLLLRFASLFLGLCRVCLRVIVL